MVIMIQRSGILHLCNVRIKTFILLLSTIAMVFLMLSSSAIAEVTEISMSPENPSPGDMVTVTGKASPNEVIKASVSFEEVQGVSAGTYTYSLSAVTIPDGSGSFSLMAQGVDDLKIEVRLPILGYVSVPGSMININGNIATFGTGKINSGTYDIKLSGNSHEDDVSLSFSARATITADESGNFVYTYKTDNMPEGNYNINIGNMPLNLDLGGTEDSPTSSPTTKKSSGKSSRTGTDLNIVEADRSDVSDSSGESADNKLNAVDANIPKLSAETTEDAVPDDYVEGFELSPEPSGIRDKLPDLGVMSMVVGIISLGAILIGYRKNRYK